MDDTGRKVLPKEPNGYKLERFIYDLFPLADCMMVLEVERDEEFAPVKNASGEDSPATAAAMVLRQMKRGEAGSGR